MEASPSNEGWSVVDAATSLIELAHVERAVAHVLLGWLPKLEDLTVKLDVAEHQYEAMRWATAFRRRAAGLLRASGQAPSPRESWRRLFERVDAAVDSGALLGAVYGVVLPLLVDRYQRHARRTHSVGDGPSLQLIGTRIEELQSRIVQGRQSGARCPPAFAKEISDLWVSPQANRDVPWSSMLWEPLDRVRRVARPPGLERCEPGSLGLLTVDSLREPRDVGIFLHSDLDEEITTLELMARNSYEHPRMPAPFHVDMARQVSDEARHARLMLGLMQTRGFGYGDFPISTGSYEALYEFLPCKLGGDKELLWRMLIRQTFMEGLALDSLARDVTRRRAAGQYDIARALDFILSDEVFHAASGLRWCRHLLGGDSHDLLQARYEAVSHYTTTAEALRARWVEGNLEKAMGELAIIEEGKRRRGGALPERPLNRVGRRQAGFTEEDILQVVSWGYAAE